MKIEWMENDGAKMWRVEWPRCYESYIRIQFEDADIVNIRASRLDRALPELKTAIREKLLALIEAL